MARHGVEYESVKHAALKLLSKGLSPSVQKVREILATGSNTTIAAHLKTWREAHAAKKVHHLPASIPEELIATFETLWHTAMEHAEKQMADAKEALNNQEQNLQQEKIFTDKTITDLTLQLGDLSQKIALKTQENQALQTKIALADECIERQVTETNRIKQQHELQLKYLLDEKHQAIEKADKLSTKMSQYQQHASDQNEKYQAMLKNEREIQENSEKRWVKLIDQARVESSNWCKKHEETTRKQNDKIESLKNNLIKLQESATAAQTTMNHKNNMIEALNKQLEKTQGQHTAAVSELAVMRSKLKKQERKKSSKKRTETV